MAAGDTLHADDAAVIRKRFDSCVTSENTWRTNALKDLKFASGGAEQWDDAAKTERTQFSQPMFTVNRQAAFLKQVANQFRLSSPTIKIAPAGEEGDEATAEVFEGVIRHILSINDGEIAVDTAFENTTKMGKGYITVLPDYLDEDSNQQELIVERVRNIFTHYPDPGATKPDLSDARFWFITDLMPEEEFTDTYGDEAKAGGVELAGIGDSQKATWYPTGKVRLVQYFDAVTTKTKKGRVKVKHIRWRKLNGVGRVLAETKLPITRIPIVPMFGDEFDIDGVLDWRGMVRDGRDPQRILNWTFTYLIEQLALASKAQWLISAGQIENFEEIWKLANRRNFPYLPFNDKDAEGRPTGTPPIRTLASPDISSAASAMMIAENQFKAVMQLFDPSLGQGKRDMSGKAALAYQQQGEIGNSNYSDNAKRCLRSLGRLFVEMIPKYYDAPRVLRILGRDDAPRKVMVHANKDAQIPDTLPPGIDAKAIFNLGVGRYDVIVTTGPNFVNKQQEQLATLLDLAKADPQIMPLIADLIAKKMNADDVVERLRMVEPLKSLLAQSGDPAQTIAGLKKQLGGVMQQHQALVQELNAKNQIIETDQVKASSTEAIKMAEIASKERIAVLQSETQEAINAAKLGQAADLGALKMKLDQIQLEMTQRHEAGLAHADAEHEKDMAATQQSHDMSVATLPPPAAPDGSAAAPADGAPA